MQKVVAEHRSSPSHPKATPAAPPRTSLPLCSGGREEAAEGGGEAPARGETSPDQFSFLIHLSICLRHEMHKSAALFLLARTRSHTQTHLWPQDKAGDTEAALWSVFQSHVLNFKQ